MSLINRMLRDLSSRQPGPRDVMQGIQVPREEGPRHGPLQRLGLLVVLVAAFTGGLWFVFGPKAITIPQSRGTPDGATAAAAPPTPTASAQDAASVPTPAPIAASAPPTKLKIDTELSESSGKPAPPKARTSTARSTAQRPSPPAGGATSSAPKAAAVPAVPAPSAEDLHAQARRALERGDAAAESLLNDALAANPNLHAAREDLGNLRIGQNRLEEAENVARVGLELDPGYVGYRRLVARIELARNRPDVAVATLERDPPLLERDLEYHALLASAYQRVDRHEHASRLYRELVRVQPQEANWWAGYAMSRDALGDVAGALAAYAQARQLGGLAPNVLEHINRRTANLQARS